MRNILFIAILSLIPVTGFSQSKYEPVKPVDYDHSKNDERVIETPTELINTKHKRKFLSKIGLGGGPSFIKKDGKTFNGGGFYMQYILSNKIGFDGYIRGYENGGEIYSEYTDMLIVGGSVLVSTGFKEGFTSDGFNPYLKAGVFYKKVSYFESYDDKLVDEPYRREFAYNIELGAGIQYMMTWKILGNIGLSFNLEGTLIVAAPEEIDDGKEGGFAISFYTMFHF